MASGQSKVAFLKRPLLKQHYVSTLGDPRYSQTGRSNPLWIRRLYLLPTNRSHTLMTESRRLPGPGLWWPPSAAGRLAELALLIASAGKAVALQPPARWSPGFAQPVFVYRRFRVELAVARCLP